MKTEQYRVREWLLLLLRFAVTHEPCDESAALAAAEEMDSLGLRWRPSGPRFFLRTTQDVCRAIVAGADGRSIAVLRKHIARIDDARLRHAFEGALGFPSGVPIPRASRRQVRTRDPDLWKGLARR
jgi:hypothetical protein